MINIYPKVNYIGNKSKIASWIIENLPIKTGKILDLFCGGSSVSYALKQNGFCVYANDILYSNFVLAKALIENSHDRLSLDVYSVESFYNPQDFANLEWMVNLLYFQHEVKELVCLVNYAKTLKEYDKFIFLSLLRRSMIRKIPYSRMTIKWEEIVKLRDEELSYQKYKRRRAYHNQPFLTHIKKELNDYNFAVFDNNKKNKAFGADSLALLQNFKKKGEMFDVVYIDPPYPSTMNNYVGFYGGFDKMLGKVLSNFTDFTHKDTFLQNMRKVVLYCKEISKFAALSLNNRCKPSVLDIKEYIKDLNLKVAICETPHIYKVTGRDNKHIHSEVLMVIEF